MKLSRTLATNCHSRRWQKYGDTGFKGDYKGICPTGWHLPNKVEWGKLKSKDRFCRSFFLTRS